MAPFACPRKGTALTHIPFLSYMCLLTPAFVSGCQFFPYSESFMRKSVKKSSSVSKFKSRASKTHRLNVKEVLRGGIRL